MTYNVYRGGEERLPFIQHIIESEQPDVLAIQEACQWMESGRFDAIGDLLNIPFSQRIYSRSHTRFASERIYDLALYSRFPVVTSKVFHDPGTVWHSLLHVTLDHLHRMISILLLLPRSFRRVGSQSLEIPHGSM